MKSAPTKTVSPDQLWKSAEVGDVPGLQAAIDANVNINSRDSEGRTALMLAARHGQTKAVLALLADGADPNVADSKGFTPLRIANSAGNSSIIVALKKAGARFYN
jgi:Meckel syndrome type 1 protein